MSSSITVGVDDVLPAVDDVDGLQALGVQPAEVEHEQLLDLGRRQPGLRRRRHAVGHEVDGLVDVVDDPRRDGVEAVGLAADDHGGDHEHGDRGDGGEHPRDRLHAD